MEAAQQLMDKDLLGSRRFAVVRDDFEQHQVSPLNPKKESPMQAPRQSANVVVQVRVGLESRAVTQYLSLLSLDSSSTIG